MRLPPSAPPLPATTMPEANANGRPSGNAATSRTAASAARAAQGAAGSWPSKQVAARAGAASAKAATVRAANRRRMACRMPDSCCRRMSGPFTPAASRAARRSRPACRRARNARTSSRCSSARSAPAAPTLWIEPCSSPTRIVPSAATTARTRRVRSSRIVPGGDQPALHQAAERHARRVALRPGSSPRPRPTARAGAAHAAPGRLDIGRMALDADEVAVQPLGHHRGGAGAQERVEHDVARRRSRPAARDAAAPPASASGAASARARCAAAPGPVQSGMKPVGCASGCRRSAPSSPGS